jgi:5-formyltetrahydrofolate cyclo-ligase
VSSRRLLGGEGPSGPERSGGAAPVPTRTWDGAAGPGDAVAAPATRGRSFANAAAKAALRSDLRRARRALAPEQRARETAATVATLWAWLEARAATALASYLALPGELDLDALHRRWWGLGRPLWLPRVAAPGRLTWHAVADPAHCRPGAYGISEPDPALVPAAPLPADATLLVPGVGFTPGGRRLGMGGGFYDRVLPHHRGPALGIGFACQTCATLPEEPHDHGCTAVVLGGTLHQP